MELIDPLVNGVGARREHNEEGAEDIFRSIGGTALIGVGWFDDGAERGEIEQFEGIEEPMVMRGDRDRIVVKIVIAIFQILLVGTEFRKHRNHLWSFSYFSPEVGVKLKGWY